ncbi:MAG: redox-sensitive transcriptional activator SoxR [Acidimicrobiales bacterium]
MVEVKGNLHSDDLLTVGQVAQRCGIAPSAIRFYDAEGLIRSERTSGGQRRFRRETLRRVAFIGAAKAVGQPLDAIRSALDSLPDSRTPTHDDWSKVADSWREPLDTQIERLISLRDQLDACIGCGCLSLERCGMYNAGDAARSLGSGPRYLMGDTAADAKASASPTLES